MAIGKQNLTTAARQWAQRPADERFWTLSELHDRTRRYAQESRVSNLALSECEVIPTPGGDLLLTGPERQSQAQFQHYSFGQFANICEAPASYLRALPAPLAAANLNHGLSKIRGQSTLMFHQNGGLHLRCVTSDKYARIWNYEIAELALALEEGEGWVTPPARPCGMENVPVRIATSSDVLRNSAHPGLGVKIGDEISPAGLYASDHDCFIFQVNENRAVDGGDGESLYRGVFWSNSEVGSARFRATMFLYETLCSNHICWNSTVMGEVNLRHTGEARQMFSQAMATVTRSIDRSAAEDTNRIRAAKQKVLGNTADEVIQFVFGKQLGLSKGECENAYVLADRHSDEHGGNPRSAWGFASGVTRLSQQQYADKRDAMDRAAGKLISMAF
jgi:hypothetical protein